MICTRYIYKKTQTQGRFRKKQKYEKRFIMFGVNDVETNVVDIYSECIPCFPFGNICNRIYSVGYDRGCIDGYENGYNDGWKRGFEEVEQYRLRYGW